MEFCNLTDGFRRDINLDDQGPLPLTYRGEKRGKVVADKIIAGGSGVFFGTGLVGNLPGGDVFDADAPKGAFCLSLCHLKNPEGVLTRAIANNRFHGSDC